LIDRAAPAHSGLVTDADPTQLAVSGDAAGRRRGLLRRFAQLYLGLDPWDVLHQGLARRTGHAIGTVVIVVGGLVLLLWMPLRQRPGIGTVSNVIVLGLALNASLRLLPSPQAFPARLALLVGGILACGAATGMYIQADFGPGPRDGLMTGLARRTGASVRLVRTGLEFTVLLAGWCLGGSVGLGTVLFAVTIGPLSQFFLALFAAPDRARVRREPELCAARAD
jgi:uncharacterized membrane protein YczE